MKKQRNSSLSIKISLIFILIVFVVMLFFSWVLYQYFLDMVQNNLIDGIEATADINSEMVDHLLGRIEIACNEIHDNGVIYSTTAEMPPITRMIVEQEANQENLDIRKLIMDYEQNLKNFNGLFSASFSESGDYSNILFMDSNWPIHVYMPKRTLEKGGKGFSSDLKVKDVDWYRQAMAYDGEAYWFVEEETGALCMAKALHFSYLMYGIDLSEHPLGVIAVKFNTDLIFKNLDLSSLTPDSAVLLYDQNETVIFASKQEIGGVKTEDILDNVDAELNRTISYQGVEYYVNTRKLPLGLHILTLVPVSDIYQMSNDTIQIITVVGFMMICLAIFMIVLLSRVIFYPLQEFTRYMAEGNREPFPFKYERRDELGILYRTYHDLLWELDESMKKELDAVEIQKQMELRALQLQINPHFIYNTLNSIACLAMLNNQDRISNLIDSLSRIIRYNISKPDVLVRIEDEIRIIKQYENIQKSCYSEQICLEYIVDDAVSKLMIPKLIIQPLIGNSIKYGVVPDEHRVCIKLKIYMESEYLNIMVWDSGRNADVEKINRYISGKLELMVDSLGVRNVYERLQITYGENAEFVYSQDAEGHTIATIKIAAKALESVN